MATITPTTAAQSGASENGKTYRGPFAIMTVLFFMWGFITVLNDILIPRLQDAFVLSNVKIMLIQSAFFGAYFIGSLAYFFISITAGDPIAKMGYKNGVVIGLLMAAVGSAMFWPAASAPSYPLFLGGLFVVGLGLAMLQIAANPYVTILGPERTASSRLNLAQAFNSVGTTIGPLIGGYLIFQYFSKAGVQGADSVKMPYLMFCIAFLALAGIFFFLHLPHVGEGKIEPGAGALKYPHVVLGMLAIFMYVGGEVSVGSNIIKFLGQSNVAGLSNLEASKFVSLFWGGMLIGRFTGAIQLSDMQKSKKLLLLIIVPLLAYLFLWAAISAPLDALHGGSSLGDALGLWKNQFIQNWDIFKIYLPLVGLCWVMFQLGGALAGRTLFIFAATIVLLLLIAILAGGKTAMWCVVSVGLFTSIGWPNIFSLALDGMGTYKSQVSSLLVTGVVGGAVLPPIMGEFTDLWNRQASFIVPLIAYGYVAFYGWKGHNVGRSNHPSVA
jgi:FHS family L-fucose permease-like MFS transporter